MTLRRRLGAVAIGYLVILGATGVAAPLTNASRAEHAREEEHLADAAEGARRLRSAYVDMEMGERGFVLSGVESFLEFFTSGRNASISLEQSLTSFAAGRPRYRELVAEVLTAARAWLVDSAEQEIATRRTAGVGAAAALVASGAGQERFATLRADLDELDHRLQTDVDRERAARERAASRLAMAVTIAPAVGLVLTLLARRQLNRWVIEPLEVMRNAVERVGRGDIGARIPSVGAADLATLGTRVEAMRATIAAQLDSARRDREAIEQNAALALHMRAELAGSIGSLPEGWSAAADLLPAEGYVAGDCYDVSLVSPVRLAVILIDIAGHGAPAAVSALKCKETLRSSLRARLSPGAALTHLADQVGDLEGSFLTAFVAVVDLGSGEGEYASAGHPPALLVEAGEVRRELARTGPIVGAVGASWPNARIELPQGSTLVAYTDGLTEARDENRAFYGTDRLVGLLADLDDLDAEVVVERCLADVAAFQPRRLRDDVTIVAIAHRAAGSDHGSSGE